MSLATSNRYILENLPQNGPHLFIKHLDSQDIKCLQAVDMFSWAVFKKYESGDHAWYDIFAPRIVSEQLIEGDGPRYASSFPS
jgi:hypothetical protein